MIRWAAALALLAASCTCGPGNPHCVVSGEASNPLMVANRVARIEVAIVEGCTTPPPPGHHTATGVTVEVLDPAGHPVPATVVGPVRDESFGNLRTSATVEFTPTALGIWWLKARFDPDIGNVQQLLAAADDRPTGKARRVPLGAFPMRCSRFGVTSSGTVVCGAPGTAMVEPELVTQHGQRLRHPFYALEGDVLWAVGSSPSAAGGFRRFVDDGGTFVLTHLSDPELVGGPSRIAAAAGDLWLFTSSTEFTDGRLYRLHPEADGGLSVAERVLAIGLSAEGIAARADRALLVGRVAGRSRLVTVFDGGTQLVVQSLAPPEIFGVSVVGADPDTVWTTGGSGLRASVDGFPSVGGPDIFVPDSEAPVIWPFTPALKTALDEPAVLFPRIDGGTMWLETFHADGYFPPFTASPTHAFAKSRDGQSLLVIER